MSATTTLYDWLDATLTPCPNCNTESHPRGGHVMRYPDGLAQCIGYMVPGVMGWIHTAPECGYKEAPVANTTTAPRGGGER